MSKDVFFDINKEVRALVRKCIMEEINGLSVRAALRESIESSGITKEQVRDLINKAIDSYVRSVDIKRIVEEHVDKIIKESVRFATEKYIHGGSYNYFNKPKELLEEQVKKELFKQWYDNYKLSVTVEEKNNDN